MDIFPPFCALPAVIIEIRQRLDDIVGNVPLPTVCVSSNNPQDEVSIVSLGPYGLMCLSRYSLSSLSAQSPSLLWGTISRPLLSPKDPPKQKKYGCNLKRLPSFPPSPRELEGHQYLKTNGLPPGNRSPAFDRRRYLWFPFQCLCGQFSMAMCPSWFDGFSVKIFTTIK